MRTYVKPVNYKVILHTYATKSIKVLQKTDSMISNITPLMHRFNKKLVRLTTNSLNSLYLFLLSFFFFHKDGRKLLQSIETRKRHCPSYLLFDWL